MARGLLLSRMAQIVERARELANTKHVSMHLGDTGRSPMLEHVSEVAAFVEEQGGSNEMIAAAWLHDIVEDTDVTLEQVEEWFGPRVRDLVDGLTDPDDFAGLPLETRKQLQADRIRSLSDDVKRVKLCDQLSNVERVMRRPPMEWSEETQFTYIEGARKIACECRGSWPELDERFDAAYAEALRRYGRA